jgi:ABC-type transport system substrate-binding protein
VRLRGLYPQFRYWLAMPFFAPMAWEVECFYAQPGLAGRNITLDWYPVGTGPFMLTENNPNLRMVLARTPNFHPQRYSDAGAPGLIFQSINESEERVRGSSVSRFSASVH